MVMIIAMKIKIVIVVAIKQKKKIENQLIANYDFERGDVKY